jgi:hypothetical protein
VKPLGSIAARFLGSGSTAAISAASRSLNLRGVVLEIAHRAGVDAIGADPRLGDVEIDFHDPALAPDILDEQGEIRLQAFAEIAAALPQEDVLGGLLADRRTAADALRADGVARGRRGDRLVVEAVMLQKRESSAAIAARAMLGSIRSKLIQLLVTPWPRDCVADHREGDRRVDEAQPAATQSSEPRKKDQHRLDDPAEDAALERLARTRRRRLRRVDARRYLRRRRVPVRSSCRSSLMAGTIGGAGPVNATASSSISRQQPLLAGEAHHRLLQLLEGAHLDLADALALTP